MNPKVLDKIKSMPGSKGIDLSIIMGKDGSADMHNDMQGMGGEDMGVEMPETSADTIYLEIKDKLAMLDSDEVLRLLQMFLSERMDVLD